MLLLHHPAENRRPFYADGQSSQITGYRVTGLLPSYGRAKRRKILQVRIGVEYRDLGSPAALAVSRRSSPMYEDNPLSVRPVKWRPRLDLHQRLYRFKGGWI